MAPDTTRKWTAAQIKEQIAEIQKAIEKQKQATKKGDIFTAITSEEIGVQLRSSVSPIIISQAYSSGTSPGGTIPYIVHIHNPNPTPVPFGHMYAHVWVGSGSIDPVVGTFLLNVDTRFPRLTEPAFPGLSINGGATKSLSFVLKVPTEVEKTKYMLNVCLMKLQHWNRRYLDRSSVIFKVI